ncbi:MAG: single-stranded-DNA-specific exonuclease RecJ [Anaerolineales bacterium]|nr:single-stranded-DNA-specific exonuclease RecJ [Anaerolineales bacterium]
MPDIPAEFQVGVGGSSILAQILFQRGLTTLEDARGFLNPENYHPAESAELPGLIKAADRIQFALERSEPILVWGDFDVDGQTSTTLLKSALQDLGGNVFHYIPNRARESHGIALPSLSERINEFSPGLILTCDTGIDAVEAIAYANSRSIDVVITDHHQMPAVLPDAFAIINPSMLPAAHPLATLPGVGVAYKLIEEIYSRYKKPSDHLLDLVALGIVADVATQVHDTRYLLQRGLSVLQTTSRLGLQELYNNAQLKQGEINEDQIGFGIGPRLNALGRLNDANSCVDFFTTTDPDLAIKLAKHLEELNEKRQDLTETIFQDCLNMVDIYPELNDDYPILVLQGSSQWNPGVIGIVASRLVERFYKPVIMLSQDGNLARGSARSISGVHITSLISMSSNLLLSYGGHPMAAGLSLALENVTQFRRSISDSYLREIGTQPEEPQVKIDSVLPLQSITEDFVNEFKLLAPFGAGNPKLLFASRGLSLESESIIGKNRNHRKLTFSEGLKTKHEFLWWNSIDIDLPAGLIDIAYSLDLTTYRGNKQIQSTLRYFRESPGSPIFIPRSSKPELIDYRSVHDPLNELAVLMTDEKNAVIWAEKNKPSGFISYPREDLLQTSSMIIWTTPPSYRVFIGAIKNVSPQKVYLFAIDPGINKQKLYLESLFGLIKNLQNSGKEYNQERFTQSLAGTSALTLAGLEWIHQQGDYDLSDFYSLNLIKPGPGSPLPGFSKADEMIKKILQEISSYRALFKEVKLKALL